MDFVNTSTNIELLLAQELADFFPSAQKGLCYSLRHFKHCNVLFIPKRNFQFLNTQI